LFGFDFNDYYGDPGFMLEQELRQRIFWLDNTGGDDGAGFGVCPTTGFYWDITLFGQRIRTTPGGVPEFLPHPLAAEPQVDLLERFDFQSSGDMPLLLRQHRELQRLSAERYGGAIDVAFPRFHRGPLDILVQLRGYEAFVADLAERPEFVRQALDRLVGERLRWNQARAAYLGEPFPWPETFIADDWLNPPFLSPAIFRDFVLPAYRTIEANEGPVKGVHTCGPLGPLVADLLASFPGITTLDLSGWNDFGRLDEVVDPAIGFSCQMRNTFVLCEPEAEHARMLGLLKRVASRRSLTLNAQSIVMLHPQPEENFRRLNDFIRLAQERLAA
ncbi:MAG: hypothetical protein ABIL09_00005, partial [Gemmatimonadota bacterium]